MNPKQIVFIVGPTAVGKSEVAISLAKKIKGEIVSCDSMQIYQEITIASNKPGPQELKKIPHHLINVVSVIEEFDVMRFNKLAIEAIQSIHRKGSMPIIVGGSGLYMQILLDGLFEGKGQDPALRAALKELAQEKGVEFLHKKLKKHDPAAAEKIHPHDLRRMVRALEVIESTNMPISALQKNRTGLWKKYDIRLFGLRKNRETLYEGINRRVENMFRAGLIDEIKKIQGLPLSLTARHLIGVKEVLSYLQEEVDLHGAQEKMKQNTRHLAKRQMTWFNREKRIQWIDTDDQTPARLAERIIAALKERS